VSERLSAVLRGQKQAKHTGRRAPHVPFIVLVTGLIVGGLGLLLLLNTASAANEVRRHKLALSDDSIAAQVQQLQNEVAASAAPGNLAQAAAALGMVPAVNPAFLVIGRNGAVHVLGSAAAVTLAPPPAPPTTKHKSTSASPTPSKTPTGTAKSSANAHGAAASTTPAKSSTTPTSTPTPTPTPTPTLTLPGGNR
jgi:hypothetical protein